MMMRGLRALNHLKQTSGVPARFFSPAGTAFRAGWTPRRLFASSSSSLPARSPSNSKADEEKTPSGNNSNINWAAAGVFATFATVGASLAIYRMNAAHQRKLAEDLAYQSSHQRQLDVALAKLSKPFEPPVALDGPYIPRVDAEAAIQTYIRDDKFDIVYLVVSGPKGSGKSTVINRQLAGRLGVFHIKIEVKGAVPDIAQLLAKALGTEDLSGLQGSPDMFIVEVCREFHKKHGKWPIIVFNVQGDRPNPEDLATLSKQLGHFQKYLSCDECVARTIADISAIAIAAGMLHDANRARFVAVPELSPDQALEMLASYSHSLQQHGVLVTDVVRQIGGNPQQLQYVASDGAPAAAITAILDDAEDDVKSYLDAHPTHHAALRQLLLKLYDVGMRKVDFDDIVRAETKKLPAAAAAAAVADPGVQSVSNNFRVIHKNLQSKHVVFHTYPHYIVAEKILSALAKEAEKLAQEEAEKKKEKANQ
jgi:hypothetical protein